MIKENITIVAAVNNRQVLDDNLLRSPALRDRTGVHLLIREGFTSAALAYNSALADVSSDLVVFMHQDIYLPAGWFDRVRASVSALDNQHVRWGVLGSFGSRPNTPGGLGRVYTTGLGQHGNPVSEPTAVQTLDEIVLIIRRSSGLRFDERLEHYHMYGVDLCLQAIDRGMSNYVIDAPCVHNTNQLVELPAEFHQCYAYVKRKWRSRLPIYASCATMTRFDCELRLRELRRVLAKVVGRGKAPLMRVRDPRTLVGESWPTPPPLAAITRQQPTGSAG